MPSASVSLSAISGCARALQRERERLEAEWLPDSPPLTVALGALGTALVRHLEELTDQELRQVVETVEDLLANGSESDQNAVATGFIEAIQSASATKSGAARFISMLGPHARAYARAWDSFCGARTRGLWDDL